MDDLRKTIENPRRKTDLITQAHEVDKVRHMTAAFKRYLEELDFLKYANSRVKIGNMHLPQSSLVLPGSMIFDILFRGTRFLYHDVSKSEKEEISLRNWKDTIKPIFVKINEDLKTLTKGRDGMSAIDNWFETLRILMHLHKR